MHRRADASHRHLEQLVLCRPRRPANRGKKRGTFLKYAAPRFATHSAVLLMAAALPWLVFHVPVGAAPAMAGATSPGTALAQAPFGRAVDGIGWSMSGALVGPALPLTPPGEKHRRIG